MLRLESDAWSMSNDLGKQQMNAPPSPPPTPVHGRSVTPRPCPWHFYGFVVAQGTVDYIFYGPGPSLETPSGADGGNSPDGPTAEALQRLGGGKGSSLRCMGVSEPPLRCDLDYFGGLPSPEEPSDHVLLAVRFEIVPPPPPSP